MPNTLMENGLRLIKPPFSNSDIYLTESISNIHGYLGSDSSIVCLSRWDEHGGMIKIIDTPCWSQDSWAINKANLKNIDFLDDLGIKIGNPRCDNKLAYHFAVNGWEIHNPATNIISIHKHESNYRTYNIYDKVNIGGLAFVNVNVCPCSPSSIDFSIIPYKSDKISQDIKLNKMFERLFDADSALKRNFDVFDNGVFSIENNQHICGSFIVTENLKKAKKQHVDKDITFVFNTWDAYVSNNKKKVDINALKDRDWVGVEHLTEYLPDYYYRNYNNSMMNIPQFLKTLEEKELLKTCHGMLFTSKHTMVKYQHLDVLNGIKTGYVYHPIVKCTQSTEFDFFKYLKNKNKTLINFGWYNRNFSFFEKIKANGFNKVFVFGGENTFKHRVFMDDLRCNNISEPKTKVEKAKLHYSHLNRVLSENILFVNLYDASANNAILDAIERNTPILVNRIPACEEYLGTDYPLFYNNEAEIEGLLTNEKIFKAYEYLSCMDKTKFTIDYFINQINSFINML